MRNFLQSLADCLWPIRPDVTARRLDAKDYLRPLIVLTIVLLYGPEVFLAADVVALLDLLGVALFITTFAVGYRMLGLEIFARIKRIIFPAEWTVFIKMHRHPLLMVYGLQRIGRNVLLISVVSLSLVINTFEALRKII